MKYLSIVKLFIITVGFFTTSLFAMNATDKITDPKPQTATIETKKDFIVGIFKPMRKSYHSKMALLTDLDLLVQDEKNVENFTEAYRQIDQSTMLSQSEKIQWIEKNQGRLPAPFLILLANYLASNNIDEAAKWFVIGSLRMEIDARKCTEKDITRGGNEFIIERLLENIQQKLKGNDVEDKMLHFTKSMKSQFENAVNFHHANPYTIEQPFWLSSHTMQSSKNKALHIDVEVKENGITINSFEENSSFKPKEKWEAIEKSAIYQMRKEMSFF